MGLASAQHRGRGQSGVSFSRTWTGLQLYPRVAWKDPWPRACSRVRRVFDTSVGV
jgi:hypothetical protein